MDNPQMKIEIRMNFHSKSMLEFEYILMKIYWNFNFHLIVTYPCTADASNYNIDYRNTARLRGLWFGGGGGGGLLKRTSSRVMLFIQGDPMKENETLCDIEIFRKITHAQI